jgi:hypothetical protein
MGIHARGAAPPTERTTHLFWGKHLDRLEPTTGFTGRWLFLTEVTRSAAVRPSVNSEYR